MREQPHSYLHPDLLLLLLFAIKLLLVLLKVTSDLRWLKLEVINLILQRLAQEPALFLAELVQRLLTFGN